MMQVFAHPWGGLQTPSSPLRGNVMTLDSSYIISDNKIGYYEKPYHYYSFEMPASTTGSLVVIFTDGAKVCSKNQYGRRDCWIVTHLFIRR